MRIVLVYFSGTGNTAWAAGRLHDCFTSRGVPSVLLSVETLPEPALPEGTEMVGFLFPVHCGYPPRQVRSFIDALPPQRGLPFFMITTYGYRPVDTARFAAEKLIAKGYRLLLTGSVRMPHTFFFPPIATRPVTRSDETGFRLSRAEDEIKRLAEKILRGESHGIRKGFLKRISGLHRRQCLDKAEWWVRNAFLVDSSCDRCGWCIRHCPTQNIRMDDTGIRFLHRCTLCIRCYTYCPQHAIQITEKTRDLRRHPRYEGIGRRPYGIDHGPQAPLDNPCSSSGGEPGP